MKVESKALKWRVAVEQKRQERETSWAPAQYALAREKMYCPERTRAHV